MKLRSKKTKGIQVYSKLTDGPLPGVSAAILAGGMSRRFGSNKALAEIGGETLVGRAARFLGRLSDDVFLVANDPEPYRFLGLPVHADVLPGHGPLSGLHAAIKAARHERVFVVGCDMPDPSEALARELIALAGDWPAVIPSSELGPEPLHAVYSRACLPAMEAALAAGDLRIRYLTDKLGAFVLPLEDVRRIAGETDPFRNINTPQDFER